MSALVTSLSSIIYTTTLPAAGTIGTGTAYSQATITPFRPPQWGSSNFIPALTMTAQDPVTGNQTIYVFDNVLRAEHTQQQVITLNPVQSGAAITDHAYIVPAKLMVEIAMSDAMQSYTATEWNNNPSKSVSAFQTLLALQVARNPVQVATRLNTYTNMMLTEVSAEETDKTRYGLRAMVTFTQILTANVQITNAAQAASATSSARPQTTGQTLNGEVPVNPVPASIMNQNNIDNSGLNLNEIPAVSGSGDWSDYNVTGLNTQLGLTQGFGG